MTKQLSRLTFVIWICVVILTISFNPKIASADCGGRNYGRYDVNHSGSQKYTAIQANIETAYPTIQDGLFSSEVLWMWGDTFGHSLEMGWRKDPGTNFGNPYRYIGFYTGSTFNLIYLGGVSGTHSYQIEYKPSDLKWHFYMDGSEYISANTPISTGGDGWDMYAGGEVTACGGSNHNAMGVSGITNLSYKVNNTGYYSWNNFWGNSDITPGYYAPTLSYNSFQDYSYNP